MHVTKTLSIQAVSRLQSTSSMVTQKESPVGLLKHACKVVRPGESLVSRTYATASKLKHTSHYTRLNKHFKSDKLTAYPFHPPTSNNLSMIITISKDSTKDTMVIHLSKCLWFFTASFSIQITSTAIYLPGSCKSAADMLSRRQSKEFSCQRILSITSTSMSPTTLKLSYLLRCLTGHQQYYSTTLLIC